MALYAFDGTWNRRDNKAEILTAQPPQWGADASFRRETVETNVHRFREFYGAEKTEYLQGVGTRFWRLGRLLGGAFGVGAKYRLRSMYLALCRNYHAGDSQIDIVGFSRGAALAVHFANVIAKYGIVDSAGQRHRGFYYYPGLGWTFRFPKLVTEKPREKERDLGADGAERHEHTRAASVPALIRFLGLWDTVASFGIPLRPFRNRWRGWWIDTIPTIVSRSFHAMALDEVRQTFALVRPIRSKNKKRHYEVWFRGVHSNVGGGYPDRGLSDIALAWMMEMYLWTLDKESSAELQPPDNFVRALQMIAPGGEVSSAEWIAQRFETLEPNFDGELGRPAEKRRIAWRIVPPDALIHHSVFRRTKNLMLDHYRSNHRLLRQIPGDARPASDPPFFYSDTPLQAAQRVALSAFHHIPVRAAEWFKVRDECVVRSDNWLAPGRRRVDLTGDLSRGTFVAIGTAWLLGGKPGAGELSIAAPLTDARGRVVGSDDAVPWVIEVLRSLEPYVPELRAFRADDRLRRAGIGGP